LRVLSSYGSECHREDRVLLLADTIVGAHIVNVLNDTRDALEGKQRSRIGAGV